MRYIIAVISAFALGASIASAQVPAVSDLPLNEVSPRADSAAGSASRVLVLFFTGDGGWASLDRKVSKELVLHGAAVVGFNSRSYIEEHHDPARFGRDVERVLEHYMAAFQRQRVVVIGYSRGADLAPFAVAALPADLRSHIDLIALLGLSNGASFRFHFVDLFRDVGRPGDVPTIPEIEKLRGMNILCVYGKDEQASACPGSPPGLMKLVERPGGHHFDENYPLLAEIVLSALRAGE